MKEEEEKKERRRREEGEKKEKGKQTRFGFRAASTRTSAFLLAAWRSG